ncbi:MAG: hypothetical protein ACJAVI_001527 [Candidatus Azotimanducaceae bacterium]|jgi:hypothetical protein
MLPIGDVFIVLHQLGNRGPVYYKRYPKEFESFTLASDYRIIVVLCIPHIRIQQCPLTYLSA